MAVPLSSAKELLAKLVAFDTTSAKTNLPLIDFVRSYLEGNGVSCQLVGDETGEKASLFARIGTGEGGIGLSGHTDVVPVAGQSWDSDPFTLTEKNGALYGRGAADMKGYLACVLAMVPDWVGQDLTAPIDILFSYDEEVGCTGVRPLIDALGKDLPRPSVVIVGEPTNMSVVDGHKSITVFSTQIAGKECHSSMPGHGVNAIAVGAAYIAELSRVAGDSAMTGRNERFDPPVSTVHVGKIEGGTALNIVPKSCKFIWEIRALPECDPQAILRHMEAFAQKELLPEMRAVFADADIETVERNQVPGFAARDASDAVLLALRLAGQNETHAVSYGTEAGLFEKAGLATVICGPGSIDQAHQPNEFIETVELEKCLGFLTRLGEGLRA